jgi:hypothetical protein
MCVCAVQGMSIIKACKKILASQGPMGFYAGVVPYVTMDGLSGAIKVGPFGRHHSPLPTHASLCDENLNDP